MLDGTCVNCLERGLKCSSKGSEVYSAQGASRGLPVWTMRAEPINASQQTDAMPHTGYLIDVQCEGCVVCV